MSQSDSNDISIGEDRWIRFIDVANRQDGAVDLDALIKDVWPFLRLLETNCVAECCGIDAFDFWPETIQGFAKQLSDPTLRGRLLAACDRIANVRGEVFVSANFNNYFDKRVLLALFEHVSENV